MGHGRRVSYGKRFLDSVRAFLGLRDVHTREVWRLGLYRARVIAQAADLSTVDIQFMDDALGLPGAQAVPVRYAPGIKVQFGTGELLHVGWEQGDPTAIYAAPIADGATAIKVVVSASSTVFLGSESGAQFVALSNLVADELNKIQTAINTHTHQVVNVQAGAATITSSTASATYTDASVAATKVKAV